MFGFGGKTRARSTKEMLDTAKSNAFYKAYLSAVDAVIKARKMLEKGDDKLQKGRQEKALTIFQSCWDKHGHSDARRMIDMMESHDSGEKADIDDDARDQPVDLSSFMDEHAPVTFGKDALLSFDDENADLKHHIDYYKDVIDAYDGDKIPLTASIPLFCLKMAREAYHIRKECSLIAEAYNNSRADTKKGQRNRRKCIHRFEKMKGTGFYMFSYDAADIFMTINPKTPLSSIIGEQIGYIKNLEESMADSKRLAEKQKADDRKRKMELETKRTNESRIVRQYKDDPSKINELVKENHARLVLCWNPYRTPSGPYGSAENYYDYNEAVRVALTYISTHPAAETSQLIEVDEYDNRRVISSKDRVIRSAARYYALFYVNGDVIVLLESMTNVPKGL